MEKAQKEQGQRVVVLRKARGWSQEELARRAGISTTTVSRFENGRHEGRGGTVRQLAEALAVNPGEIMGSPPTPLGLDEPEDDPFAALQAQITDLRDAVLGLAADNLRLHQELRELLAVDRPEEPGQGGRQ